MASPPEKPCVSNQLFETTSLKQKYTKIASYNRSDPKINRPQGSPSFLQWKGSFKTNGRGKRKASSPGSLYLVLIQKARSPVEIAMCSAGNHPDTRACSEGRIQENMGTCKS